jgi:hypothetical protein
MVSTKVATEVESFFDGQVGEVLVTKSDDLALGDEQGELVFTGVAELGELDAGDFGAGRGGQVGDLGTFREEVLE